MEYETGLCQRGLIKQECGSWIAYAASQIETLLT
jgi:hypothetical protein